MCEIDGDCRYWFVLAPSLAMSNSARLSEAAECERKAAEWWVIAVIITGHHKWRRVEIKKTHQVDA